MGVQSLEMKTFFGPKCPRKTQKNLLEMGVRLRYHRPPVGGLLCKYELPRERAFPSSVRGEVVSSTSIILSLSLLRPGYRGPSMISQDP